MPRDNDENDPPVADDEEVPLESEPKDEFTRHLAPGRVGRTGG